MNVPQTSLHNASNILLLGIGGGFDVFTGLPFLFHNRFKGKFVLANCGPSSEFLYRETTSEDYPEFHIKDFSISKPVVYSIGKHGSQLLKKAFQEIITKHNIDTILAVDGGVDSLAVGDEESAGTILEDFNALGALSELKGIKKILCCAGFGAETEENMNHYRILENIANLAKEGYFLGSFSLTKDMAEFELYKNYCELAWADKRRKSHIQTKIISAVEGQFGENNLYQDIDARVIDSTNFTFISPLSSIYWMFDLDGVASKNKIIPYLKKASTFTDSKILLRSYMTEFKNKRSKITIPL